MGPLRNRGSVDRSMEGVHGPGPDKGSMDGGPCFVLSQQKPKNENILKPKIWTNTRCKINGYISIYFRINIRPTDLQISKKF